jgi:putative ABC transport system permease protein
MWSVRALTAMLPDESIYRIAPIALDWRVLTYTIGISVAAGILFGILPALKYSRAETATIRAAVGSPSLRLRGTLLVAQTALAVTLIAAAGMLTKSFLQIWRIDGGFSSDGVMATRLTLTSAGSGPARVAFFERVIGQLAADPEIASSAAVTFLPLSGGGNSGYITLEDRQSLSESPDTRPGAARLIVAGDYFRALGIALREGRVFSTSDDGAARPVVIVNEALARLYWPDQSPIGRRIKRGTPNAQFRWLTIVGVVGDVRQQGLGAPGGPTIYLPLAQSAESSMTVIVKSDLSDAAAAARIRSAVRSADRDQPVGSIRSLDDIVFGSISGRWLPTMWMGAFAGLAMVLAALGVYGVVIYAVEQRRREFGVRLALGADRSSIIRLALRHAMIPTIAGTMIGIGAAFVLARFNSTLFVGVQPFDMPTFVASAVLLAAIAYAASYLPARRIADEDAVLALRAE